MPPDAYVAVTAADRSTFASVVSPLRGASVAPMVWNGVGVPRRSPERKILVSVFTSAVCHLNISVRKLPGLCFIINLLTCFSRDHSLWLYCFNRVEALMVFREYFCSCEYQVDKGFVALAQHVVSGFAFTEKKIAQ